MDRSIVYGPRFTQHPVQNPYAAPPTAGPGRGVHGFYAAPPPPQHGPERKRSFDEVDEIAPVPTKRHLSEGETVFRLLLPESRVKSVMSVSSEIRMNNGCLLRLCDQVPAYDERVVVISAKDERKDDGNIAMVGLLDAVRRALTDEQVARESARSPPNPIYMIRLLINRTQAGALIGKGGTLNKDIREKTGAYSKILNTEDIPVCALHNDRVVQVTGSVEQVMAGMEIIARQLRDNLPKERPGGPPPCLSCLSGFTLYYAHEAPPYIPATHYGRPMLLHAPLQSNTFQLPQPQMPGPMYSIRPSPNPYMPYTPPAGGQRPYVQQQHPMMYSAQPGRPPTYNGGGGPTYFY